MLEDISIKDFALIDSLNLDLNSGFTVLSGETGAGKSILIGALSFLLGGKGGVDQIRPGCSEARVSGTIYIKDECKNAFAWLEEHGITPEDNRVLLRRIVRDNGKSGAWIQDTPVTRVELSDFTSFFVDIHGQHEHQSLMKVSEHIKYLDSYAQITDEVAEFSSVYKTLIEKRNLLEKFNTSDAKRSEKIELLSFAVSEIEEAKLKPAEDVELDAEENRLSQYEKLYENIETMTSCFSGESDSILQSMKKLRSVAEHSSDIDKNLEQISTRINNAFYELTDINDELKTYKQSLVFDPERLEEIQERQALIFKLKKKYCSSANGTIEEILDYAKNAKAELEELSSWSENAQELINSIKILEKDVFARATKISEKRKSFASKMSTQIEQVLSNLGMAGSKFSVSITQKESSDFVQKCGPLGMDNVEFLICANKGGELKPLAKIASGGEISRVMLAMKTILAESDTVDTLIFDEIDTGIGGEVSVSVGSHIKKLSQKKQILCITHLASIAVYADTQIRIEKNSDNTSTKTSARVILGQERVEEIARMLSGDSVDSASCEHARKLLEKYSNFLPA